LEGLLYRIMRVSVVFIRGIDLLRCDVRLARHAIHFQLDISANALETRDVQVLVQPDVPWSV
jgi:hypothetical protein